MMGCDADGDLNGSGYSKSLPWMGLYIATASLICALAMAADVISNFHHRRLWFPSRFFSLNATTLAVLAAATKFTVDLNTSMPGRQDQLTKLSGTVLLCTFMGHGTPSLGSMGNSGIASNVVALGILVVTIVVDICIQISSGVIFAFLPEHILIMICMLVLLLNIVISALTVPITKRLLDNDCRKRMMVYSDEGPAERTNAYNLLKKLVTHTSSPQHVLGCSATCTVSGAFCVLSVLILAEASVRSFIQESLRFCSGNSHYGWSTTVIFVAQATAVWVGTVPSAYRCFNALNFISLGERWSGREEFIINSYYTQKLMDFREAPLPFHIDNKQTRKIAHNLKYLILDSIMSEVQTGYMYFLKRLLKMWESSPHMSWLKKWESIPSTSHREGEDFVELNTHISWLKKCLSSPYMFLVKKCEPSPSTSRREGDDLVELIMRTGRKDIEQRILKGQVKRPTKLIEHIEKYSTLSNGFIGVDCFDSVSVPSIVNEESSSIVNEESSSKVNEEPPNCWALPLVTLAGIVVALPNIDHGSVESLLEGIWEGLIYVRLIEKHLDGQRLLNMRKAANILELQIDLYNRWFDEDLHSLALEHKSEKEILKKLGDIGKNGVLEHQKRIKETGYGTSEDPREWPAKVLAANCMYRVSETILLKYDDIQKTNKTLFDWLQTTIVEILVACLTNLPRAIKMECFCCLSEVREEVIWDAAFLLGQAEKIMEMFESSKIVYPNDREYIDSWSLEWHYP